MSTLRVDNIQKVDGTDQFLNSEAESGYQKLPGGLIIQWGTVAAGSNITFPIAFPTACLNIMMTTNVNNTASSNISHNHFYISATTITGATRGTTTYQGKWIAFGY